MLRGFTVGITADRRWDEQAALFERRGATVLHGPAIRTLPLGSDGPLRAATEALIARPPAGLVANTGLGIRSWFSAAETWGLGDQLVGALRGPASTPAGRRRRGRCTALGLDVPPRRPRSGSARRSTPPSATCRPGSFVAVQIDGSGDTPEIERMRARRRRGAAGAGLRVELPDDPRPALRLAEAVVAGRVHAVTFTAGPAVRNWLAIAGRARARRAAPRRAQPNGHVVVGCVGPVCAEVAVREGIGEEHLVVPAAYRLGPAGPGRQRPPGRPGRVAHRLDGHDVDAQRHPSAHRRRGPGADRHRGPAAGRPGRPAQRRVGQAGAGRQRVAATPRPIPTPSRWRWPGCDVAWARWPRRGVGPPPRLRPAALNVGSRPGE